MATFLSVVLSLSVYRSPFMSLSISQLLSTTLNAGTYHPSTCSLMELRCSLLVSTGVPHLEQGRMCQDPEELAIIAQEGSPMGPLLRAVNEIARAVTVKYPHVAVDTLACKCTGHLILLHTTRWHCFFRPVD